MRVLPASTCSAAVSSISNRGCPGPAPALGDAPAHATSRFRWPSRTERSRPMAPLLPGQPGVLRRVPWTVRPRQRRLTDLEPGVLRQHDARQRPDLANARRRAASVSLPHPQWLQRPLPAPQARYRRPRGPTGTVACPSRRSEPRAASCPRQSSFGRCSSARPNGRTSSSTSAGWRKGRRSTSSTRVPTSPSGRRAGRGLRHRGPSDDRPGHAVPHRSAPGRPTRPSPRAAARAAEAGSETSSAGSRSTSGSTHPGFDGPIAALLGTVNPDGTGHPLGWADPITEKVAARCDRGVGDPQLHRGCPPDPHPRGAVPGGRSPSLWGSARGPETWESGLKDTVIAYPGEITRVKAHFDRAGLYVGIATSSSTRTTR